MIIDNFSRYTWVLFLSHKNNAFDMFVELFNKIIKEKKCDILYIRSDHGMEFENQKLKSFYSKNGINHNFSALRTSHQNRVVERKLKWHKPCFVKATSQNIFGWKLLTPHAMC